MWISVHTGFLQTGGLGWEGGEGRQAKGAVDRHTPLAEPFCLWPALLMPVFHDSPGN